MDSIMDSMDIVWIATSLTAIIETGLYCYFNQGAYGCIHHHLPAKTALTAKMAIQPNRNSCGT